MRTNSWLNQNSSTFESFIMQKCYSYYLYCFLCWGFEVSTWTPVLFWKFLLSCVLSSFTLPLCGLFPLLWSSVPSSDTFLLCLINLVNLPCIFQSNPPTLPFHRPHIFPDMLVFSSVFSLPCCFLDLIYVLKFLIFAFALLELFALAGLGILLLNHVCLNTCKFAIH